MNYLIIAATAMEVKPLLDYWHLEQPDSGEMIGFQYQNNSYTILISGIGMMSTAFYISRILKEEHFDLVVNVGIAGSFDSIIGIGSLVVVKYQQYGDLGASGQDTFQDFFDLKLLDPNVNPFKNSAIHCPHTSILQDYHLIEVSAVSVNNVSGNRTQIDVIKSKYDPQIEVMEGIAVHFACSLDNIPYLEIRTISNFVEERNKSNWKVKEAIETLNDFLIDWLKNL